MANVIWEKIDKLLRVLDNEELARKLLPVYLTQLQQFAQRCEDSTKITKEKFDSWSLHAEEFLRACCNSKDATQKELHEKKNELDITRTAKEENEQDCEKIAKDVKAAEENVERLRKGYEKALEEAKPKLMDYMLGVLDMLISRCCSSYPPQNRTPDALQAPEASPDAFEMSSLLLSSESKTNFRRLIEALSQGDGTQFILNYRTQESMVINCVNALEQKLTQHQHTPYSDETATDIMQTYRTAIEAANELIKLAKETENNHETKLDIKKTKHVQTRLNEAYEDYNRLAAEARRFTRTGPKMTVPEMAERWDGICEYQILSAHPFSLQSTSVS